MKNISSMLAVAVEHYLKSQNWHFQYDDKESLYADDAAGKIESSRVYIIIGEDCILTYAMLPNHIPEGKRDLVCRFIARANYGMRNGNLEMDLNDGEVRYKTYLYAKDRIPAQNEIERYIDISLPDAGPLR